MEILLKRYSCMFGLLVATILPLSGCGEQVSQPMNDQGEPVDPPEPPETPAEGLDQHEAMRSRPLMVFPAHLVTLSHQDSSSSNRS